MTTLIKFIVTILAILVSAWLQIDAEVIHVVTEAIHHLKLKFTQNDDSDNSYA